MTVDIQNILFILKCPVCGEELERFKNSLRCQSELAHTFPIINGIPRFVAAVNSNYEIHWTRFSSDKQNKSKIDQAGRFMRWLKRIDSLKGIVLDIGCGDGNHIPFIPNQTLCVALDYTSVVDVVKEKYKDKNNLILIQANALSLPFKDNSVDFIYSYGCLNYLSDIKKGVSEVERVSKKSKYFALWGFGTNHRTFAHTFTLARNLYRAFPETLRWLILNAVVPMLFFIPNSTGIHLLNSTWRECREIISTNLSPGFLTILDRNGWDKYVSEKSIKISEYSINKGAIYQKTAC